MKRLLTIDPGSSESAWLIFQPGERKIINGFGKEPNMRVLNRIGEMVNSYDMVVVERMHGFIGGYKGGGFQQTSIGTDVLDTTIWIGRFIQAAEYCSKEHVMMYRRTVSTQLCRGISHPKDKDVRAALIARFGEKGTMKNPGPLFGLHSDCWSALALGAAYTDKNVVQTKKKEHYCETRSNS